MDQIHEVGGNVAEHGEGGQYNQDDGEQRHQRQQRGECEAACGLQDVGFVETLRDEAQEAAGRAAP